MPGAAHRHRRLTPLQALIQPRSRIATNNVGLLCLGEQRSYQLQYRAAGLVAFIDLKVRRKVRQGELHRRGFLRVRRMRCCQHQQQAGKSLKMLHRSAPSLTVSPPR